VRRVDDYSAQLFSTKPEMSGLSRRARRRGRWPQTRRQRECRCSHRELTTALPTAMTTVGLPDTFTYTTTELVSCLVEPSACAHGSEGSRFSNPFGRTQLRDTSEFVAP
jgi:hypothetical protein